MIMIKNKTFYVVITVCLIIQLIIIILITNKNPLKYYNKNSVNKSLDYFKTSINWSEYKIIPKEDQNLVLVLGEARSGTSFLGDLLHQSWTTFYAYEPLFSMRVGIDARNNQTNSQNALDILTKIFECDFENLNNHMMVLWKNKRNMVMQKYPDINDTLYWNKTINQYVCQRCDTVLIKSIRISVKQFIELQQRLKRQIKLIFNTRDPRAVMNSRYNFWMTWCFNDINCGSVEILCQRMREDLGYLREVYKIIPGMVSLVRSEDLSLKPHKLGKALFGKLGLEFNPGIEKWIENNINDSTHLKDPYYLGRQSKDVPFSWTMKLNSSQVKRAEDRCSDVMQLLGYKFIDYSIENKSNIFSLENILSDNFELGYMRPS